MANSIIHLTVNRIKKEVMVRDADTLLDTLRTQFGLTGAKPGCRNGDCGACCVLIDGVPLHACMMLAVEAENHDITTIEGLKGTPIQKAFLEHAAFQCGYCTPGFIINAHALVNHHPGANDELINEWLTSNLCRCTSYSEIRAAVKSVLRRTGTL